jgi:hypothetical protein
VRRVTCDAACGSSPVSLSSHLHLVTPSSALRIRPGHVPAKKKLQQARDALDAKAAAMRAQIDAAIEKAQEQQIVEKEKEKVTCGV